MDFAEYFDCGFELVEMKSLCSAMMKGLKLIFNHPSQLANSSR